MYADYALPYSTGMLAFTLLRLQSKLEVALGSDFSSSGLKEAIIES